MGFTKQEFNADSEELVDIEEEDDEEEDFDEDEFMDEVLDENL